ncbi:MAG: phosphate-binding protein [Lachnospiraceae bacterium]|nr:phosphate-binding protein [Lachnospiraceae bacterium]
MDRKKRARHNPYAENHSYINNSTSNPPPPDYDEYYMFTVLYVLFVPVAITIIMGFNGIFEYTPLFVAFMMFLYAYLCIAKFKLNKPDSLFELYLPILAYLGWQLFLSVIFTLFIYDGAFIYAFLSLNFYGVMYDPDWQLVLLFNWIYNLLLSGGFAAGERLAFHKTKVVRKSFRIKYVRLILIGSAMMILISEGVWFYKRRDIIERDPEQGGYGFAYENGYSSTNLEPYYVENKENILARLDEPSTFMISEPTHMPVLDGAEAAYPVYSAFANACYENIGEIQEYAKQTKSKDSDVTMPVKFNNSVIAFEDLVAGETDIFFGAKPSKEQQELATEAGKELILTPIGKEAFIFFVNSENPVNGLTSDQIRDIYSGEITNWNKIGGARERILAFQRPENSGSQTMMEYFMGDVPLKEPLQTEHVSGMGDLFLRTANYQNRSSAIGYSFRYFATIMVKDMNYSDHIKYLSVDGIYPDEKTIRSGEYPFTTELYAVTLVDNPNENVKLFLEWMTGPQGQQIVSDTGYVALQSP